MRAIQSLLALIAAASATYFLATVFYTQQVIAGQEQLGIIYTFDQTLLAIRLNFLGLGLYGAMILIALAIGFAIAKAVKLVLRPLAAVAYPIAGAAAMFVMLTLIETRLGGGAGIIGGASTPLGVALQCFAGFSGGLVFVMLRPR